MSVIGSRDINVGSFWSVIEMFHSFLYSVCVWFMADMSVVILFGLVSGVGHWRMFIGRDSLLVVDLARSWRSWL